MFPAFSLPEQCKIVGLLSPATDAAGRTSDYVSLRHAIKAWIIVRMTQGHATPPALALLQASAVAPTGSKVFTNAVPIWSNLDESASDTLVARTAGVGYSTDAGLANKTVIFEIDPAKLDIANGFDCVAVSTGASNVANITEAMLIAAVRYPSSTPPTMITD